MPHQDLVRAEGVPVWAAHRRVDDPLPGRRLHKITQHDKQRMYIRSGQEEFDHDTQGQDDRPGFSVTSQRRCRVDLDGRVSTKENAPGITWGAFVCGWFSADHLFEVHLCPAGERRIVQLSRVELGPRRYVERHRCVDAVARVDLDVGRASPHGGHRVSAELLTANRPELLIRCGERLRTVANVCDPQVDVHEHALRGLLRIRVRRAADSLGAVD